MTAKNAERASDHMIRVNSFALAVRRGVITAEVAVAATAELDDDVRSGRLTMMGAMWRRTLDLAAELSAGPLCADWHVLHVATAKTEEAFQ